MKKTETSNLTELQKIYRLKELKKQENNIRSNSAFLFSFNSVREAKESAIFEKYEGAIFVDFVPTSENLAAWLLTVVQEKMKDLQGVEVLAVEYWETPKSHCRVEA